MSFFDIAQTEVRGAVERALAEDIGSGDITSELTVPDSLRASGTYIAKQDFVCAGIELLAVVFGTLDKNIHVQTFTESGLSIVKGQSLAQVTGPARALLAGERVSLNFLQRLSGIASLARRYVSAVQGTRAKILDTRKTTPGLRQLEKMAAAAGGATNHRKGLFDAVLIKNNHITAAGGVRQALKNAVSFAGPVEIEVRTADERDEALACGAKSLLLDNLTPSEAKEWIRVIDGRALVELSGGINLETVRSYAEAGPDFISCGAITHSATAVDISFRLELSPT